MDSTLKRLGADNHSVFNDKVCTDEIQQQCRRTDQQPGITGKLEGPTLGEYFWQPELPSQRRGKAATVISLSDASCVVGMVLQGLGIGLRCCSSKKCQSIPIINTTPSISAGHIPS